MNFFRRGSRTTPAPAPAQPAVDDSPTALRKLIGYSVTFLNANSGRLPAAAVVNGRHLTDTLAEVLDAAEVVHLNVHDLIALSATLNDYLPSTLKSYLRVDASLRDLPRGAGGLTPTQSLMSQIAALQTSADTVLAAVQRQDADTLMTQGTFLRTKFDRSDLDL